MAAAAQGQAIAGVSAGKEAIIETVYPSIAKSGLGRMIGSLCDSIDAKVNGVKISALLFGLPLAPLGVLGYFKFKIFDPKYVLTNRSVQVRAAIGNRLLQRVDLVDIDNIAVTVQSGQAFYHAGDLDLINDREEVLLTLPGVPRPKRFRQVILDARDARVRSDRALGTIEARG
ncbi:MAG: hypothetical protein DWQ34_19205 [Planctomycetota bacterium]|nr:MAG: hypothetical protein DWQ34_19205 [Planctomycetota bacterium]REK24360.1 MAG: hypothetical protein DWQ41_15175 [Planctomycetota bacterium]REK38551.1 MAG: hypothetical protein DWQ45_03970 [Planctomycetota bacterium]